MDKEEVKDAVKEAIKEERKSFHIDSELHYNHHQFLIRLMKWFKSVSDWTGKIIIGTIVSAIIALIVLGIIAWGKSAFKGP